VKKVITVVGARPQFIKLAALSPHLRKYFLEVIVHTGQHYDNDLSEKFFNELDIPIPDYNLDIGSGTPGFQIGNMIIKLEEVFLKEKPSCIIVFGDTNSTAAAAIVAAKLNIKLAHIEAGLREFDKSIPEETNKLITDILTDFYFCPTITGVEILKSMGITTNVYNVGDVMIDLIEQNRLKIENEKHILTELNLNVKDYVLVTFHRASNTDNVENLKEILNALNSIKNKIIFPIHPRTLSTIQKLGLLHLIKSENILLSKPLGYFATQTLIHYAKYILTDSGGVTKEAYYHRTQAILLDKQTEWVETLEEGWNIQAGPNCSNILYAINHLKTPKYQSSFLGNGDASLKISKILFENLHN
jgi:UDP-N-acetylglucosamine 2-epimerase